MYLKKSGFICLNVYINLPYLFIILEMTQMYFKKDRSYLSKSLYKSPVLILYRYFKKRMIEKKQITITYCRVLCK